MRKVIDWKSLEQGSLCQAPLLSTPTCLPPPQLRQVPSSSKRLLCLRLAQPSSPGGTSRSGGLKAARIDSPELPQEAAACQSATLVLRYPGGGNSQLLSERAAQRCKLLNGSSALSVNLDWLPHAQMSFSVQLFQNRGVCFTVADYPPKYRASKKIQ